jgi:hypothetical protein
VTTLVAAIENTDSEVLGQSFCPSIGFFHDVSSEKADFVAGDLPALVDSLQELLGMTLPSLMGLDPVNADTFTATILHMEFGQEFLTPQKPNTVAVTVGLDIVICPW